MRQCLTDMITGFVQAWLLSLAWSVSAGPATPSSYYALITAMIIWVPISILSLFFVKPAAVLALTAAVASHSMLF